MLDPAAMDIDPEEVFGRVSIERWIPRDPFLPVKEQLRVTMVLEGMEMESSRILLYRSYNELVTIQLPAEAAGAIETPKP